MEDMPDIGSLGGNFYDASGENSVTSGELSPDQSYANEDVNANPWGYDFSSADFYNPGDTGFLGGMFDYNQATGLPTSSGNYTGNVANYGTSDFFNSRFGKIAGIALGTTPVGKAFNIARGLSNTLGNGNYMGAAAGLAGSLGGLPGAMINAGYNASKGNFSNAGALAGGLAGGPVGSFVGGQAGSMLNGRTGGATGPAPSGGFNMEGAVGGLAQLYAASQAGKGSSAAASGNQAVQDQISQLSNMYSQNSPYAQQLRQELERKDAKAGRRSQYGPREVQLQAALADKAAQTAGTIGSLATSNQNNQLALQAQKNKTRAQQLALLMNLGKQSGAFGGLNNLFSGGGNQPAYTPPPDLGQGATFDVPDTSYWENA